MTDWSRRDNREQNIEWVKSWMQKQNVESENEPKHLRIKLFISSDERIFWIDFPGREKGFYHFAFPVPTSLDPYDFQKTVEHEWKNLKNMVQARNKELLQAAARENNNKRFEEGIHGTT